MINFKRFCKYLLCHYSNYNYHYMCVQKHQKNVFKKVFRRKNLLLTETEYRYVLLFISKRFSFKLHCIDMKMVIVMFSVMRMIFECYSMKYNRESVFSMDCPGLAHHNEFSFIVSLFYCIVNDFIF